MIGDWLRRDDVVDSAWGMGFILIALFAIWHENNYNWYKILTLLLVSIWGLRLSWHLTSRNSQKNEDWRYKKLRSRWKKLRVLQTYSKIYLFQGLLVLIIGAPVIAILTSGQEPRANVAVAGFAVWCIGIVYEAVADYQLKKFKDKKDKKSSAVFDQGLWRYSRHPNYFGEIVSWLGAATAALSTRQWWAIASPVVLAYMLLRVSGEPLLRKKFKSNKTYQQYVKTTSLLVPLPPKKRA